MRLIPLDDEIVRTIEKWVGSSGVAAPDPQGLPMCAGIEPGRPRAFGTVRFYPRLVVLDGLSGASVAACRYVIAMCEEWAVAQSATLMVRGIGEKAAQALLDEGAVNYGGTLESHLWARDPAAPKPAEGSDEPGQEGQEGEFDDEDEDDLEDDDEDEEEAPPPPPKKKSSIEPRRKRKNKRKK